MGVILTTHPGIVGSFIFTYAGQALIFYKAGGWPDFIGAVIGAISILIILSFIAGRPNMIHKPAYCVSQSVLQ